jgi:RNA ligase
MAENQPVRLREEYVSAGLLRSDRSDDGTLAIYTYTDRCVFENAWDAVTRNARGHVYNLQTGECVAWAFPKFFNLGENAEVLPEKFPWDQPYEIMEKMDGWLGVLYRHEGAFKVATRGSFHSSGAVWATEYIQRFDLSCLPDPVTLCFEIIAPEQRIILDYGAERRLVVLAAFNRTTGEEYPRSQVEEWARTIGLPVVPLLGWLSLEDLLHKQKALEKFEGFVIRFCDGRRVKVKTEWYLSLARSMANLTPIAVWDVMAGGKVPAQYLIGVPEELRPLAERYQAVLEGQYARVMLHIEEKVRPILEQLGSNRAVLGRYLDGQRQELGYLRSAAFLVLDGKASKLDHLIKGLIYPRGNQFVADAELLVQP